MNYTYFLVIFITCWSNVWGMKILSPKKAQLPTSTVPILALLEDQEHHANTTSKQDIAQDISVDDKKSIEAQSPKAQSIPVTQESMTLALGIMDLQKKYFVALSSKHSFERETLLTQLPQALDSTANLLKAMHPTLFNLVFIPPQNFINFCSQSLSQDMIALAYNIMRYQTKFLAQCAHENNAQASSVLRELYMTLQTCYTNAQQVNGIFYLLCTPRPLDNLISLFSIKS